ncbi:MAG TPA: endonuclease/exonuclease/phosphatase family protein, partial [Polyangia bacterium]|nr:endonuclease/exonuclease/phosphatase family protein [Polyangia bacterium]
ATRAGVRGAARVAEQKERRRTRGERLRRAILALAVAYPAALLLVLLAMRGVGERSPLATILLYLPRPGFALPLPPLVFALLFVRPRRWLLTQLVAALILLFPVMGLRLHGPRAPTPGAPRFRLLSANVDLGSATVGELASVILGARADVVCLQEAPGDESYRLAPHLPGYVVRADGQFIVASRFPITDVYVPPALEADGARVDPNFVRYRIAMPGGLVDVYNMHPASPHNAFDRLRGDGLLHELASGRLFVNHKAFGKLRHNARLRELQVRAVAEHASAAPYPVLVAGDTNLPSGSWILGHYLGGLQDGFVEAGRGFGYTFPARRAPPWLRLDRVLGDGRFRFVAFSRLDVHVSKHFPVVADVERVAQKP